ncbi:hypothetical protein [Sphingosinicella sp. BN140058]|uniref:hypothetical protein n=1 Tax=Sphingosinicella sp. BN140058 TaxID=1892855 RepID=UPI001010930E|nr:hypothetical protein [Sphingosinicella sp. BN140058]QAY78380.1 hypothetical protein ETR14_18950 [Sphingosinicella sp. BN140058]
MRFGALCVMAALYLGAGSANSAPPKRDANKPPMLVRLPAPPPKVPAAFNERILATIGDWQVGEFQRFASAFTSDHSGSTFGFLCGENCLFYFDLQAPCGADRSYSATIEGPAGRRAIALRCVNIAGLPLLSADAQAVPFNEMLGEEGGLLSISVTVGSEPPIVALFSLAGGAEAVRQAIDRAGTLRHRG